MVPLTAINELVGVISKRKKPSQGKTVRLQSYRCCLQACALTMLCWWSGPGTRCGTTLPCHTMLLVPCKAAAQHAASQACAGASHPRSFNACVTLTGQCSRQAMVLSAHVSASCVVSMQLACQHMDLPQTCLSNYRQPLL